MYAQIDVHVCACVYISACVDMYMCVDMMYQCKRCIYSLHAAECHFTIHKYLVFLQYCNINADQGFTSGIFFNMKIL